MLVADGRFKWTSTAEELLGSDIPGMHAEWRSVTLEELLRHRGGAPSVPAPARATFAYSNQGYAIVGRMIEVASGKDFESLLAERLLVPLNIKDFGFGIPMKANESSPSGHAADATPRDMDNPNAIAPTGTSICQLANGRSSYRFISAQVRQLRCCNPRDFKEWRYCHETLIRIAPHNS